MKEQEYHINIQEGKVIDVDVLSINDYIGITDKSCIITPYEEIKTEIITSYPIIRKLKNDSILLVDARRNGNSNNGFILNSQGVVLKDFLVGDGVEDIVVQKDKIIVSYFDEGIFGNYGPNEQGIAVFDFEGNMVLGFENKYGNRVRIVDCYALCGHAANKILFFPYTDFPLVELDIESFEINIFAVPEELRGANAITSFKNDLFFHSPYTDDRGIFRWNLLSQIAEKIGEYSPGLRGLKNGKFLSKGDNGFTIIDLVL
jgi:hypothetical protein